MRFFLIVLVIHFTLESVVAIGRNDTFAAVGYLLWLAASGLFLFTPTERK